MITVVIILVKVQKPRSPLKPVSQPKLMNPPRLGSLPRPRNRVRHRNPAKPPSLPRPRIVAVEMAVGIAAAEMGMEGATAAGMVGVAVTVEGMATGMGGTAMETTTVMAMEMGAVTGTAVAMGMGTAAAKGRHSSL
jgi:hypothetical protein